MNMKRKTIGTICLLLVASLGFWQACVQAHPSYGVVSFKVTPMRIATGEKVTIKAEVQNVNSETDTYNIPLMVNGVADSRKSVTLAPGQSELLTFELTRSQAGSYRISVGDRESILTVEKPSPPDLRFSNLVISPEEVDVCESVTITATVKNIGGSRGSYTAELKVDGITNQAEKVTLSAGADCMLCFKVAKGLPGTYKVALGDLSGQFTVKEPASPVFDIPVAPPCPPDTNGSCDSRG
jgi:hypothetical protein